MIHRKKADTAAASAPPATPPMMGGGHSYIAPYELWTPPFRAVLMLLLAVTTMSAAYNGVWDCDEVYNFIEPTHYLVYGKGFQTWEYSPLFALRSYMYILPHAVLTYLLSLITMGDKIFVFYLFRLVLGAATAYSHAIFFRGVTCKFGQRAGRYTLLLLVCSPGLFISSTAMLPNTFCMVLVACSFGWWFEGRHWSAVTSAGVSVLIGWPYTGLIYVPLAVDTIISYGLFAFVARTSVIGILILTSSAAVDYYYYGRFIIPVLNHIAYNVVGSGGSGGRTKLYGEEPVSFYFLNSFLNLNVTFLLFLSFPVFILLVPSPSRTMPLRRLISYTCSAYLWFFFMLLQAHKEERFMFAAYPLMCHIGALALERVSIGTATTMSFLKQDYYLEAARHFITRFILASILILSVSRTVSITINFQSSIEVYKHLYYNELSTVPAFTRVCVGKEWYRFPSSFFIPDRDVEMAFLRSSFTGQLPQAYSPHANGTWVTPLHMNDINREEPSRYVDVDDCNYIVDFIITGQVEEHYEKKNGWLTVYSAPYLDSKLSPTPYRSFYIPFFSHKHNVYGQYVLLRKQDVPRPATVQ